MKSEREHNKETFDDRLFVIHLCKGTVKPTSEGLVITTIYHEQAPSEFVWCVVTYRNCVGYPVYRVDSFLKRDDAISYIKRIEPITPLKSLGGNSPLQPLSHEDYLLWKKEKGLKEYDWKEGFLPGGSNAREDFYQTADQFKGIN